MTECTCRDCGNKYENDRDYTTSICDECFKKFLSGVVQPLRDRVQELEKMAIDREAIDKLSEVFYSVPQPSKVVERWEEAMKRVKNE